MKTILAGSIIICGIYLCMVENIVKNSFYKEITEKLLLFLIILCSIFNLVLIKLDIGSYNIEIGILTILLLTYLYTFYIMYKKRLIKKSVDKKNIIMLICLSLINIYILIEPMLINMYSAESYSLYLFTYFNVELILIFFLVLRKFNYKNKTIISVVSVFSIMNATLGLLQFITGRVLINFKDSSQQITELYVGIRVSGFVIGDNGGGNLGAILFPLLLYKYNKDKNILNFSLILADILFVIFTFTRIAYLAIFVEVIIFILFSGESDIKGIIKNIATTIGALGVGIYVYLNYYTEIIYIFFLQRGETQYDRFTQFTIAIKTFFSTPFFGTGHGQYNDYAMSKLGLSDDLVIHSQFLNMIVEEGIIIFILFVIFNICLIYMLIKKYSGKMERLFIIMLFIGNLICVNFNPNQTYEIVIYIYYFILFGLLFAKDEITHDYLLE
ncbi:O-antigen ligase [Clostridium sp.]|uniref:O-antigen ligase family protein n=1 Tax=Clostridium sp. TaxID=1506 RepID=UPI001A478D2F|nr:O-antigen ligase family protein [Clostridium sp.]MBK5240623.1 O-antigen ligase family protein [Clostridium sp.]